MTCRVIVSIQITSCVATPNIERLLIVLKMFVLCFFHPFTHFSSVSLPFKSFPTLEFEARAPSRTNTVNLMVCRVNPIIMQMVILALAASRYVMSNENCAMTTINSVYIAVWCSVHLKINFLEFLQLNFLQRLNVTLFNQ